jgi:hypothetical protein
MGCLETIVSNSSSIVAHAFVTMGTCLPSLCFETALAPIFQLSVPPAATQVRVRAGMCGLWWTKRHWGRFSLSTSVSPANHHSTNFSIIIITQGWHNRPIGGRTARWTQSDSTPPPLYQLKKIPIFRHHVTLLPP